MMAEKQRKQIILKSRENKYKNPENLESGPYIILAD